jgi:hypothetical protein
MIEFISSLATDSLNHTSIQRYRWFAHFPVTAAHALGFQVFTSRLLATDLNIQTSTSNHYEVFLQFRLQSLWNLRSKNSSGLNRTAYNLLVTAPELILSLSVILGISLHSRGMNNTENTSRGLYSLLWRDCLRRSVFTEPLLRNRLHKPVVLPLLGADDIENTASSTVTCWTVRMFTDIPLLFTRVEAGSNTSTVTLRVVRGDEMGLKKKAAP